MTTRFAINGLGRIGRALLRIARQRSDLELVAVNDLGTAEQLARLVARDTLHGSFSEEVRAEGGRLVLGGDSVRVFNQPEAAAIPWEETSATVVVDATGLCKDRACAQAHRRGPIDKVIVSANAEGMDLTICMGINHGDYDASLHHLLSAASCTTNCLVPVAWLLDREYGIEAGLLDTVHSYNNDQSLLDAPHSDPRRARAAALNMVPTSTSAIQAAAHILPRLAGRLQGLAVRVPTPNVSLIDLVVTLEKRPGLEELAALFRRAESGELAGILATTDDELVSSDFLGQPHSAIVDLPLLQRAGDRLYRVIAWYDNEWGHASRLADLLRLASSDGPTGSEA
jgi:glyceraldehyde 3-phosphate dehydrogenase (phosphorylating)